VARYQAEGEQALVEKSRARHHHPNETPLEVVERLLEVKGRYPYWGPKKVKAWLERQWPELSWPAASTVGDILKRYGLVKPRRYRRRTPGYTEPFVGCEGPNRVWSADFKGQFRVGDGRWCYPLTVSDNYSRYLLSCEGLVRPTLAASRQVFERLFATYGLPEAIRTDNGAPFAGVGLGGLSQLSIWWLKLGILPERIAAGHPEQNGRHERMHRTLKEAVATPPGHDLAQQCQWLEAFRRQYNEERSHEGIGGRCPAEVYTASVRPFPRRVPEMTYPGAFLIRQVRSNGEIKWEGHRYFVSELLYGEPVGLEVMADDQAWIYFGPLRLGLLNPRLQKIIRA